MPAVQPKMPEGVTVADVLDAIPHLTITIEVPAGNLAGGLVALADLGGWDAILTEAVQSGATVKLTTQQGV